MANLLDSLTDLLFPQNYHNSSGIYQIHYVPVEWVSSIALNGLQSTVNLLEGKDWKLLESTRITQGLTITPAEDDQGIYYKSSVPGHLPDKSLATSKQLILLQQLSLIIKATDNDGYVRIIGNITEFAELKLKDFNTKGLPGNREGYSWEIVCINSSMPPFAA